MKFLPCFASCCCCTLHFKDSSKFTFHLTRSSRPKGERSRPCQHRRQGRHDKDHDRGHHDLATGRPDNLCNFCAGFVDKSDWVSHGARSFTSVRLTYAVCAGFSSVRIRRRIMWLWPAKTSHQGSQRSQRIAVNIVRATLRVFVRHTDHRAGFRH